MRIHRLLVPLTSRDIARFWAKVDIRGADECWPIKRCANHIYGDFSWGGLYHIPAHRVAYFAHYGVDPTQLLVCHSCDNPPCCNPSHLFLGDHLANRRDCMEKDRHAHKLTEVQVLEVRRLLAEGTKDYRTIAAMTGIGAPSRIQSIRLRDSWRDVGPEYIPAPVYDRVRKGKWNGRAKLTEEQIPLLRESIEIRKASSRTLREALQSVAIEFGVSEASIADIYYGRHWKHVA